MNALSPWASAFEELVDSTHEPLLILPVNDYTLRVHCLNNVLFIVMDGPGEGRVMLRSAYTPVGTLTLSRQREKDGLHTFYLDSPIGKFVVTLQLPGDKVSLARCTTSIEPAEDLLVPFWPRELIITTGRKKNSARGEVLITQEGTRTGLQFIQLQEPSSGTLLYLQNLTALNEYCSQTETSASGTVGGKWPELGFALPPTKDKPLRAGKSVITSDAFLFLSAEQPADELKRAKLFLSMLADIYMHIPRPDTQFQDWQEILQNSLKDLENSHACWLHKKGNDYLNAYVCDYATPPELMVQLAVLLPLTEYKKWSGRESAVISKIREGLPTFFDEKLGTVVRWLPEMADELDQTEEQLKPNVMDSWYLHHPMINLCRLALDGDILAKDLFLKSIPFAIKVARHFKYNWPVFYDMETLEAIKAETAPGMGGEKDVAGMYALLMMNAYKLTADKEFLREAEKAGHTLKQKGFKIFYQANNTMFAAKAMIWLYKETRDETYLDLSYLCIAGIMKNVQLWECNYGFAKNYNTFFGVFPLNDAPYTAAYEEQEVFAAMHEYLVLAEGETILPAVRLLLAEQMRYLIQRGVGYYPPNLPEEMISKEVKMGEVDRNLWIALEDIYDGWLPAGQVGQEVYGAGVAFGIVPKHYHRVKDEPVTVFIDYPVTQFRKFNAGALSFRTGGDKRLNCRMVLISEKKLKPAAFHIVANNDRENEIKGIRLDDTHIEFILPGDAHITVGWK